MVTKKAATKKAAVKKSRQAREHGSYHDTITGEFEKTTKAEKHRGRSVFVKNKPKKTKGKPQDTDFEATYRR